MKSTLLVVAAGRGERLGGPKALLLIDGRPLAELHARSHSDVVIVAREEVQRALGRVAHFIAPDRPIELGPAGSIGAAVRSGALRESDAVIITPVDVMPAPALHGPLLAALEGHAAARPARGHPVAIRGEILRERYRDADPVLREVLDSVPCARLAEAGVLDDLDTPDDVVRITGAGPRFLV